MAREHWCRSCDRWTIIKVKTGRFTGWRYGLTAPLITMVRATSRAAVFMRGNNVNNAKSVSIDGFVFSPLFLLFPFSPGSRTKAVEDGKHRCVRKTSNKSPRTVSRNYFVGDPYFARHRGHANLQSFVASLLHVGRNCEGIKILGRETRFFCMVARFSLW